MLKSHKPIIWFLAKFLGIYVIFSLLYGFWIESYSPKADPATYGVTVQSAWILEFFYDQVDYDYYKSDPVIWMGLNNKGVVNVFEGCNGINVFIIFIAFIVAYKGPLKDTIIWTVSGLLILHIANLSRVSVLFAIADIYPEYIYFMHKYFFTASIYGVVFLIWYLWIRKISNNKDLKTEKVE